MLPLGSGKRIVVIAILGVILGGFSICFGRPGTGIAKQEISSNAESTGITGLLENFDQVPIGKLPDGWKAKATNPRGGAIAGWKVAADSTAPSGKQVLTLTIPEDWHGGTFNICMTNRISFLDGEIGVHFKAVTGREDQGGGVIWRAKDENNYYIARFNPLEDNFRIYRVLDGSRKMLESAKISLEPGKWHSLRIVQKGNHFQGYIDGKKLLEGTDDVFSKPGGVGLWTKADAATCFDDFSVLSTGNSGGSNN
jgi:hypothetical protein